MLKKIVQVVGGDPHKREIEKFATMVEQINGLEGEYESLDEDALRAKTTEFRARLAEGESLDDILVEAFAAVREASKRTIGLRHYDIQLVGGIALHEGKIAEMRTGEGKTLVATLPLYLNALTRRGVHLVTVNDYLARRDARWMGPIYNTLGMSTGVLQMAARTEHGKKAFLVDLERESPHEDQHQLYMVSRAEAYAADITYGTNSEFGFDYLRDNMTMRMDERVQRGHYFCIIDEVDNVLIDEARTPLIISGPAQDEAEWYLKMAQIVKQLRSGDYEINEKDRNVTLTELGEVHVEELLNMPLRDPDRPEDITPEQARMLGYLEQALRAQFLFRRNKDYLVQAGKVVIVDEFTGRLMPGRRWSDGLHQAVEAKEGVRVQAENVTYATITIQNYYRMYEKLSGMTGTAVTEAEEFDKIYSLDVLAIPTNLEYQASRAGSELEVLEDRDESGYKYTYYAQVDVPDKGPVFWKRKDYPDIVYRTEETKLRAVTREIMQYHVMGRPILLGTTSVELSERISTRLRAEPLRRLAQVLLIRDSWFKANDRFEDGRQVEELQYLNAPLNDLQTSDMRKMARELGLSFNPEEASNVDRLLAILNLTPDYKERLVSILQAGIPHEVLNARKHTEESQIITGAGAFGALTIATNMAGRGVDIKLGGELAEEILTAINRVLRRAGYEDPYDMSLEDRRQALSDLDPSQYGIYETEIKYFFQYMEDMERVRDLGGLHVIGSERHEARRIDNQLRGRSSRQGDPGSSRFYLSMEDELMRLFGGQQADNLMQRMKIDDAMPLEVGLVGRIVEQSQNRVEGANFDVRKHLLEYDDVLNTQRAKIYAQRDRIFTKHDLNEDVTDMLRVEVNRRVAEALEDEDGPWRLLAWMDQIQPPIQIDGIVFPSYTMKLLVEHLTSQWSGSDDDGSQITSQSAVDSLLAIASQSLDSEEDHLTFTVNRQLDLMQDRYEDQLRERQEAVETFFEALDMEDETEVRSPRQVLDELSSVARIPLRLSSKEQRTLTDDPYEVIDLIQSQVETYLLTQSITRLIGLVERRLEQTLGLNPSELTDQEWNDVADQVLGSLHEVYDQRRQRLIGDDHDGQIAQDLDNAVSKYEGPLDETAAFRFLILIPQGSKAIFDKKTHRRVFQRTTRLTYIYYAAQFLLGRETEEIIEDMLGHLEMAQKVMHTAWGRVEWNRVADSRIAELDEKTQHGLAKVIGEDALAQVSDQPLAKLDLPDREAVAMELGRQALTEVYRQLLLYVITELWVDYLTQMEALRVSIGLEAYAQRDPLVQYKNRAYELFQELVDNMRISVVTRMYTFRPRDLTSVQTTVTRPEPPKIAASVPSESTKGEKNQEKPKGKSKKRRRRRRRR
jgi:preprotein translocase subunit SecA